MGYQLIFHHVGCLVDNMDESIRTYTDLLGFDPPSEIYDISSQKVKVCFIKNTTDSFIELVEPYEENTSLRKMLKKGQSFYHTAYTVKNFDEALKEMEAKGARFMPVFTSEAFNNKRCVFFFTPELQLIELIESI